MKIKLYTNYTLVFCMGFFGLLSQTLLFRIFLTVFDGNELSIGLFFFSWLTWVSLGAWIANRKRVLKLSKYFHILVILYIPLYLSQSLLFINAYAILGNYSFEIISLKHLIPFILLCNAPISFISGFLFVIATKWLKDITVPVIKTYICESLGSFCGALIVTLLLYFGITDETVFIIASLILLISSEIYLLTHKEYKFNKFFNIIIPCLIIIFFYVLAGNKLAFIQNYTNRIEWNNYLKGGNYSGTFYTPQAKYHYGRYKDEFVVSAWNSTYESLPNTEASSLLTAEYLSQNPKAKNILIIGPGTYSFCRTFANLNQIDKVTWLDTDPYYPKKLIKILTEKYLNERTKLIIPGIDIRTFLQTNTNKFDIIILNLPTPNNLLLNRYFTYEFFLQLRDNLSNDGVAGISFPAEANYLGPELSFTGSSLMFTLGLVFKDIVLKPGSDSCFFAAKKKGIVSDKSTKLIQRLKGINGIDKLLKPELIASAFEKSRIEFQLSKYKEIIRKYPEKFIINTDRNPKSFLFTLLFTIKKLGNIGFSETNLFLIMQKVFPLALFSILIYFFLRIFYYFFYYVKKEKSNVLSKHELYFFVFAAALSSIGINLLLIFLFQIYFGTVFLYFGIITAFFMLGLFLSGILAETLLKLFSSRNLLITISSVFVIVLLIIYLKPPQYSALYFSCLFFIAGSLCGPYFVLAAHALRKQNIEETQTGSRLESFDNLGGAVGSIICSLILLPTIGIDKTLIVLSLIMVVVILHSSLLKGRRVRNQKGLSLFLRVTGYIVFALLIFFLINFYLKSDIIKEKTLSEPTIVQWQLTDKQKQELGINDESLESLQHKFDHAACTYYAIKKNSATVGYVFKTNDYTKDIHGFAGPIHMLSYVNPKGKILNFTILETNETPAYLEHVLSSKNIFLGQNVSDKADKYHIKTVTGATITSTALSKTLLDAGNKFISKINNKPSKSKNLQTLEGKINLDLPLILIIILSILAILLRFFYNRTIRLIFTCTIVLVLGFIFNIQYSIINVISLLSLNISIDYLNAFVFLSICVPVLIIFFGNIYCGYLCPFGALQELIYTISTKLFFRKNIRISSYKIWNFISSFKYVFLFMVIFCFIFNTNIKAVENTDILTFIFSFIYTSKTKYFIIAILLISVFYKRFWCRVLCPSGAFLSMFNAIKLFVKTDKRINPGRCNMGIFNIKAIDCICCDNCRIKSSRKQLISKPFKLKSYILLFLSIACFIYILIQILIVNLPSQLDKKVALKNLNITPKQKSIPSQNAPLKKKQTQAIKQSIGSPKNINLKRYKEFIHKGYLSSKEAEYYKRIK